MRNTDLQTLIDGLASAALFPPGEAADAAAHVFTALKSPGPVTAPPPPSNMPVLRYLEPAFEDASAGPGIVPVIATAVAALAPALPWYRRADAARPEFENGHANAQIIGPNGLEVRDDVVIGVSLMAPGIQYPDHQHPPAEVYVVMSDGEWRQEDGPWHRPGRGGLVFNPPNIVHAMRAGDTPLLAIWCLAPVPSPD